jgi:hypothetical protein
MESSKTTPFDPGFATIVWAAPRGVFQTLVEAGRDHKSTLGLDSCSESARNRRLKK